LFSMSDDDETKPTKISLLQRLFGDKNNTNPAFDVAEHVHLNTMLTNLTAIKDVRVGDIMVPRADIVAISASATLAQAAECFVTSEHSRLPVYRETLDDPLGFVHLKDLLPLLVRGGGEGVELQRLVRNVLFVPPSVFVLELLLQMQARRLHMALIVDEYGGTDGLITIEDIVEQIVGRIDDEHDIDAPIVPIMRTQGTIEADARLKITDLMGVAQCASALCEAAEREEVDTLGGLITALVGRVPQRGEIVTFAQGIEFHVLDADPRRVRRLRLTEPIDPDTPLADATVGAALP
jgi:magnesium and cobalt transporter